MRNINNSDNRINVDSRNYSTIARFRQEDDATLVVNLYKNGEEFDVSNQTITLRALRLDGQSVNQTDNITKNKNIVTINLRRNILAVIGRTSIQLNISDSSGQFTTAEFFIEVEKNNLGSDALKGSDNIQALHQILIDFKAEKSSLIKNITDDYNSLKKIIIDQNQAANLQNQINLNKQQSVENTNRIEQLEDLTPVWQEHSGTGNITVNDSFDGIAKDLVVKGKTLQNLMNNYSFIRSTDSKAIYLYLNDEILSNFTFKNITNKTLNIQFSNLDGSYKRQVTLSPGQYITCKDSTEKFRQLRGEFEFGWENNSINYEQLLKNILINGEAINLPNMYFDSIASAGEKEDNKIKIKSIGKNFFSGEKIKIINNTSSAEKFHFEDVSYLQEGSYCISYKKTGSGGSEIYLKIGNKYTQILGGSLSGRFSIPNTNEKIELRFDCNGAYTEIEYYDIQIEKGSNATNYEQYREKLIEIQLPFQKGLKSTLDGSVYDEINGNTREIIQRVSDEYTALSKPVIHKINDIQINTFDERTHITQENNILSDISFKSKVSLSSQAKRLTEENKALKEENRELREDTNTIVDSLISVFEPMMLPDNDAGGEKNIILEKLYAIKNR